MIKIRKGTPDDIIQISTLLIHTWQSCYTNFISESFLTKLNLDKQVKRHTKYFQNGIRYYVATKENLIVGFTSYGKNRIAETDSSKELYTLYVNRRNQGMGIGKALLNTITQNLKTTNKSLSVLVFKENPYRSFYAKNDFKKTGEQKIVLDKVELITEIYTKTL